MTVPAKFRRIFAISDLHVDYKGNRDAIAAWSDHDYRQDVLIVAGDVTDRLSLLEETLEQLMSKFAQVFYVPGNHELWIRRDDLNHSLEKFSAILDLCQRLGVSTQPAAIRSKLGAVRILPLFSWYMQPEEGEHHLYFEKKAKDETKDIWNDFFLCKWPDLGDAPTLAHYFHELNEPHLQWLSEQAEQETLPTISFSHFLPRQDLVFSVRNWRENLGKFKDPLPQFNFTRVAGTTLIDDQLRRANSAVHVYGHQHRNRWRSEDDVLYVSHCMGYPKERQASADPWAEHPKLLWVDGKFAEGEER